MAQDKNKDALRTNDEVVSSANTDIFSFIYLGYNKNNYFWEVIMFLKKLSLTFISVFTEFFPSNSKAIILLVTLICFLYLNVRRQPYVSKFLTKFDTYSLAVSFITAGIGVLLFSEDLHPANPFFMVIIVSLNVSFLVIWIYYFFLKSFGSNFWMIILRTLRTQPWKILSVLKMLFTGKKYSQNSDNIERKPSRRIQNE